jgi:hypothetical protein
MKQMNLDRRISGFNFEAWRSECFACIQKNLKVPDGPLETNHTIPGIIAFPVCYNELWLHINLQQ